MLTLGKITTHRLKWSIPLLRYLVIWLVLVPIAIIRVVSYKTPFSDGDRVLLSGKVKSEPVRYSSSQGLNFHEVYIYLPAFPEINYGDEIVVEGIYKEGKLQNPKLHKLTKSTNVIYTVRNTIIGIFIRSLPKDVAALTSGMVIGTKTLISESFWEKLKATGTAHVVVASGMNVTLVAGFLVRLMVIFVSRKKAVLIALVGIWIYAVMAGFDAPIVRAGIMGSIGLAAVIAGRLNLAWRSLILSAVVMLIIWPYWIGDLGFILSFMATLSIMFFERPLASKLKFIPGIVRQDLSTSLAAQIGVAPILFFEFGQLNVLSPLINVFILWTVVPITIIGILGALVGLVFEQGGQAILYLNYPLATWFLFVVDIFS
ncbi:ComEC/Rec2 family competence protein [Candidatus Woesebacteria bacterium]|nr:MAG: ComEC/Rec2 family competence protein [Candidatus Woesebacteria bacterium]